MGNAYRKAAVLRSSLVYYLAPAALAMVLASSRVACGQIEWSPGAGAHSGVDQDAVRSLFDDLRKDPNHDIKGVVILRHDRLVEEAYFNGDNVETLHDIRSATKSITATLMGLAIQQRLIGSVDDPIAKYLPGLTPDGAPIERSVLNGVKDGKQAITIRDLLNMRSGLDSDDEDPSAPGNEDRLDRSADWIKTVYAVPMKTAPGKTYVYCSLNAFLTGAIIENASKIPLDEFARRNLFAPLGIARFEWRHVPVNRTTGQGNLSITARDEAKLGTLFLHDGVYSGRRIVNRAWVEESVADQVAIADKDPYADHYGYMWYSKVEKVGDRGVLVHFASGNGGNKIYVVPSLDMVVAITSSAYGQKYGQRRSQDILLKVLAAVRP